jgi:hypothetical protein
LEHRASNPVSVKNLNAIETSAIVKLLRLYVPERTKRTSSSSSSSVTFLYTELKSNVVKAQKRRIARTAAHHTNTFLT